MISFQNLFYEEFSQKANYLYDLKTDKINSSKEFIFWAESKIIELHLWLKTYDFENDQDEIFFFKEIKPCIISKLIFQKEVLRIETSLPRGKQQSRKFYEEEIKKISEYHQKDIKFHHYYRSNSKELDNLYFTRKSKKSILETECFQINSDTRLSTFYDYKVAKIIANDELVKYLESQLAALKMKVKQTETSYVSNLYWSGTKTDLAELIYALHAVKIINNGKTDIKEIATELGKIFNVELNESIYRSYIDIKNRKNSKTKFIDNLSENFNKKILEGDY
ncbi:RteC domain-containing protein [Flavobacterium gawalongense]|uniref:RteC protein n=1 Tax=Flavobacterium gawalongense TaxID=2594432 RepID=A0ABY3CKI0_9FLAO|nr:RteC domain-containing protein [Flavobacterium gawalongense]TRX01366.1 hypothetical protein FNW33_09650 [Flavobacterium gawalongense]TRX05890.1 hypothetical protein FNW12_09735 [Flavobacterium gawalongense]